MRDRAGSCASYPMKIPSASGFAPEQMKIESHRMTINAISPMVDLWSSRARHGVGHQNGVAFRSFRYSSDQKFFSLVKRASEASFLSGSQCRDVNDVIITGISMTVDAAFGVPISSV